jgi:hypothetical protein
MRKPVLAYTIGDSRYLNITDRCSLRRRFWAKHCAGPQVHEFDLTLDHRPTVSEIIAAIGNIPDYREIVFCGFGEPTLRLKSLIELADWVDAPSVSLNAQTETLYEQHCRPAIPGSYSAMLDFLQEAPGYIRDVSASAIDGLDGVDIDACRRLAEQRGTRFKRRVLDVVG